MNGFGFGFFFLIPRLRLLLLSRENWFPFIGLKFNGPMATMLRVRKLTGKLVFSLRKVKVVCVEPETDIIAVEYGM